MDAKNVVRTVVRGVAKSAMTNVVVCKALMLVAMMRGRIVRKGTNHDPVPFVTKECTLSDT